MLVLFATLLCFIQAQAIPADSKPGLDLEEANANGLVNPSDLIPKIDNEFDPSEVSPLIYIEPKVTVDDSENIDDEDEDTDLDRAPANTCGCGYSITNPASGRIVNGKEVSPVHKLPYQVRLQICYTRGCFLCGGTLLNKRYVLSAMHCIYNKDRGYARNVKAVIGEHNTQHDWETKAKEQAIQVVDMITRQDYNTGTMDNDIVILKLGQDVQMSKYVVPACLPSSSGNDYTGKSAVTSGWGAIRWQGPTSPYLKETTVRIVSSRDRTCRRFRIDERIKMCAYAYRTDSCQGDSGGPLVLKENGKNTVVGVVSYGTQGCAVRNIAGVYAKVTGYLDWIKRSIKDGWCDGSEGSSSGGGSSSTVHAGKACDLTCYVGTPTGNFIANGIQVKCVKGICSAVDGSDLCATLGISGC